MSSVAVVETSYRRGHEYLTLVADMQARRVVFVTTGNDATTMERFRAHLCEHGGSSSQLSLVSPDMSPAFIKGVKEHFPEAQEQLCRGMDSVHRSIGFERDALGPARHPYK
jgi:transposase